MLVYFICSFIVFRKKQNQQNDAKHARANLVLNGTEELKKY